MTAVVLALAAAALWGTGDFLGGLATRRVSVLTVLFWSQLVGLAGLSVWVVASGAARPGAGLWFALAGGIAGVIGLGCLYRGMAVGAMGIVAPISATSPIVPLGVDLLRGNAPAPLQWVGIAFALAGIVLVSREPGSARAEEEHAGPSRPASGWRWSRRSGSGCSSSGSARRPRRAPPGRPPPPASAPSAHSCSCSPRRGPSRGRRRRLLPLIVAVGVFDAAANALIALAASRGSIGIVAVLSSLYPITTILLARAILHERLGTTRTVGGLIALGGAALIAAG